MAEQPDNFIDRSFGMVVNFLTSRLQWLQRGLAPDRRRNIDDECGHREYLPTPMEYFELYLRNPIGARVVEVYPKESWQVQPYLYETEDPDDETPFEKDWADLTKNLQTEIGYHKDEKGNPIWEMLKQLDILSGIGRYGVLFLGLDDIADEDGLQTPVNLNRKNKLLYMTPLAEIHSQIVQYDSNLNSPRYGLPEIYNLVFSTPGATTGENLVPIQGETATVGKIVKVHWTRVIHVLDNPCESKIFGIPRMQQVIDIIDHLHTLYGSSTEMYYKGAFPGLAFEGIPGSGPGSIDMAGLKKMGEDYQNGLQRLVAVLNMTVKSLSPQVVDPSPQIERNIEVICIKLPCPKRIFMGSERGELASDQDTSKWNKQLSERHSSQCTPRLIVPFTNRLININVLRKPTNGFSVAWPDITNQTPAEKSQVTFRLTQALAQFLSAGGEKLMTPLDFLTVIMGIDEKVALSVIKNRKEQPFTIIDTNPKLNPNDPNNPNPSDPNNPNPTNPNPKLNGPPVARPNPLIKAPVDVSTKTP